MCVDIPVLCSVYVTVSKLCVYLCGIYMVYECVILSKAWECVNVSLVCIYIYMTHTCIYDV